MVLHQESSQSVTHTEGGGGREGGGGGESGRGGGGVHDCDCTMSQLSLGLE